MLSTLGWALMDTADFVELALFVNDSAAHAWFTRFHMQLINLFIARLGTELHFQHASYMLQTWGHVRILDQVQLAMRIATLSRWGVFEAFPNWAAEGLEDWSPNITSFLKAIPLRPPDRVAECIRVAYSEDGASQVVRYFHPRATLGSPLLDCETTSMDGEEVD